VTALPACRILSPL